MAFTEMKKFIIFGIIVLIMVAVISSFISSNNKEVLKSNNLISTENSIESHTSTEVAEEIIKEPGTEQIEQPAVQAEQSATEVVENKVTESFEEIIIAQETPVITFKEGTDYITRFPNESPNNQVLMEFFSYNCPHCFNFEPTLHRWKMQKPEAVELLKVPVTFGRKAWELSARAYYIAQELNLEEQFSKAMFRKIHIENKEPVDVSDIGAIFLTLGVDKKTFNKAATSFIVNSNLSKAEFLAKKFKVAAVPYFLINKKYETGKDSYESEKALFRLWNNLPAKDF